MNAAQAGIGLGTRSPARLILRSADGYRLVDGDLDGDVHFVARVPETLSEHVPVELWLGDSLLTLAHRGCPTLNVTGDAVAQRRNGS